MSTHAQPQPDPLIESITAELRDALVQLRKKPSKGGRKVTVHIADNWASAYIELPPEYIRVER